MCVDVVQVVPKCQGRRFRRPRRRRSLERIYMAWMTAPEVFTNHDNYYAENHYAATDILRWQSQFLGVAAAPWIRRGGLL